MTTTTTAAEIAAGALRTAGVDASQYAFGKTKIFIRSQDTVS